jgi:hypothetical protein
MKTFIDPNLLQRLRVGPLAPYLGAYLKHIEQEGFLPSSAPMQMYAIARFSKWLRDRQFDLHQVDEAAVNRFLKRDPGVVHSCESATLRRLLAMLQQIGVTVAKASDPETCHQRFIVDYRRYLLRERGLAEATLVYFVRFAEQFLSARFGNGDLNLSQLCAKDVTDFVRNRAHQLSPGRAKLLVTALRSLLRYLRHQGEIPIDLARCVLPVAMWSLSTLPKFLPAGTVQRLLDQCERETPRGKRNYAVLLLLARLGLRACEIAWPGKRSGGHEHTLAIFDAYMGLQRGRCVGASAVPVFTDQQSYTNAGDLETYGGAGLPVWNTNGQLGNNGTSYNNCFALMTLSGLSANVDYYQVPILGTATRLPVDDKA